MELAFLGLQGVAGIVSIVCFIMVILAMFKNNQANMGIICLVLLLCGIGALIAFIYGWMKSSEWSLKNVMIIWTIAVVIGFIGGFGGGLSR